MEIWLGITIVCANLVAGAKNPNISLLLYFFLSLILPNTSFSGSMISYEILAFIPIALQYLFLSNRVRLQAPHVLLFIYVFIVVLSSSLSLIVQDGTLEVFALLGIARFAVLCLLAAQSIPRSHITTVFLAAVVVNTIASLVQSLFPESISFFYTYYFKESATPLSAYLDMGFIPRTTGTFNSPVSLGAFSLISISLFISEMKAGKSSLLHILCLIAALCCGLLAVSKLFFLGLPVLLLAVLLLGAFFLKRQQTTERAESNVLKWVLPVTFVAISAYIAIDYLYSNNTFFQYSFAYMSSPLEALDSRYDSTEGILAQTMEVIANNPLIGVGKTSIQGEFSGDSAYFVIMHDAGIIGAAVYLAFLAATFIPSIKSKDLPSVMLALALAISGIASTVLFSIPAVLAFAYILSGRLGSSEGSNPELEASADMVTLTAKY